MMKKVLAIVLATVLCVIFSACDATNYKNAETMYALGDYAGALQQYAQLGGYKDSYDKILSCKYKIANEYLEEGNYQEAQKLYFDLEDYKDSQEKFHLYKYITAEAYLEQGEYEKALEIYSALNQYEDAADKADLCKKEIGMRENADYAFLEDMKKTVLEEIKGRNTDDQATQIHIGMAYLEKYKGKTFYDPILKDCLDTYLDGLETQKGALTKNYYYEYQIEWQKGVVKKCEALKVLYENYDFLADNAEFIGIYISQYKAEMRMLNGLSAVDADIEKQTKAQNFEAHKHCEPGDWEYGVCNQWDRVEGTLKNNTEYTFGVYFTFSFKERDTSVYATRTVYIPEVKPQQSYVVKVEIPDGYKYCTFDWTCYYEYVK